MDITLCLCFMQAQARALYGGSPNYATEEAAGFDLRACIVKASLTLPAHERVLVPTGIAIHPKSHTSTETEPVAGFIYSRSGLGAKHGIIVAQGVGVVDSDYRGEIMVMLLNTSTQAYTLQRGERIAQLVLQPIIRPQIHICETLEDSTRGSGGFGHTGKL